MKAPRVNTSFFVLPEFEITLKTPVNFFGINHEKWVNTVFLSYRPQICRTPETPVSHTGHKLANPSILLEKVPFQNVRKRMHYMSSFFHPH